MQLLLIEPASLRRTTKNEKMLGRVLPGQERVGSVRRLSSYVLLTAGIVLSALPVSAAAVVETAGRGPKGEHMEHASSATKVENAAAPSTAEKGFNLRGTPKETLTQVGRTRIGHFKSKKRDHGEAFEDHIMSRILESVDEDLFPPHEYTGSRLIPYPGRLPFSHSTGNRRMLPQDSLSSDNSTVSTSFTTLGEEGDGHGEIPTEHMYEFHGRLGLQPAVTWNGTVPLEEINTVSNKRPADFTVSQLGEDKIEIVKEDTKEVVYLNIETGGSAWEYGNSNPESRQLSGEAGRDDFAIGLLTWAVCTAIGSAVTAGVGTPLIAAKCLGFAIDVFAFFVEFVPSIFGNPTRDDAHLSITAGTHKDSGGNAIQARYWRQGEYDQDGLGYVGRNQMKDFREDLDSRTLDFLELRRDDWDDICIANIGLQLGPEPAGNGRPEMVSLGAPTIYSITEGKPGMTSGCVWFGDSARNALTNLQFYWRPTLSCMKNYGDYNSDDFNYCMKWAAKSYDILQSGGRSNRYTYSSNNMWSLPKFLTEPFRNINNRYNGWSIDLHERNTWNRTPVNGRPTRSWDEPAQGWDIDRLGRIRSRLDPTKCLVAGVTGELYTKAYIYKCDDGLHMRWDFYEDGRIRNKKFTNRYLGIAYCGTNSDPNRQRLELRNYEDGLCGESQKWRW